VAQKVHDGRRFPATTVERLYEDKNVRDFLGFDFDDDGDVMVNIARREFEKGFKKVIEDVVTKEAPGFGPVDSRTLNDEKNRKAYLDSFPTEARPKRAKSGKVVTAKDFDPQPEPPKLRKKLASNDIGFSLKSKGVLRMLVELQTIDYHRYANAAHDLLRSFLECALKAYFQDAGKTITPPRGRKYVYLDDVLDEFIKEMDAAKNHRLLQVARRIRDTPDMSSYSPDFLNAANHNPDLFAVGKDVEAAWDQMEPLLRYVLNPVKPNAPGNP
jgi:hypothetical protein